MTNNNVNQCGHHREAWPSIAWLGKKSAHHPANLPTPALGQKFPNIFMSNNHGNIPEPPHSKVISAYNLLKRQMFKIFYWIEEFMLIVSLILPKISANLFCSYAVLFYPWFRPRRSFVYFQNLTTDFFRAWQLIKNVIQIRISTLDSLSDRHGAL